MSKFSLFVLPDPLFANLYPMTAFLQICTQWPPFVYFGVYLPDDPFLKSFVPNDPIFIPVLWMTPILWTWMRHTPVSSDRECLPRVFFFLFCFFFVFCSVVLTLKWPRYFFFLFPKSTAQVFLLPCTWDWWVEKVQWIPPAPFSLQILYYNLKHGA